MQAVGMEQNKVTFDQLLKIFSIFNFGHSDRQTRIKFAVNLFIPQKLFETSGQDFEYILKEIYNSDKKDKNFLVESVLSELRAFGVYKPDGYLNTLKLEDAFLRGIISADALIQTIK